MEVSLQKLEDMTNYLENEFHSIMEYKKESLNLSDAISHKVLIFSILTMGILVLVIFLEVLYVKKFLNKRKLI